MIATSDMLLLFPHGGPIVALVPSLSGTTSLSYRDLLNKTIPTRNDDGVVDAQIDQAKLIVVTSLSD